MEEPKCRPEFVDTPQAFIDFTDLRHPSMCLRADNFIPNNVQLGAERERTILLTGPNMAGKSTLLRMTAAGVIMAQMGCYVPASSARLSPIDRIQTRMGAYDNMFASASTFKVELDECSKILREAGPKSLVILDGQLRFCYTFQNKADLIQSWAGARRRTTAWPLPEPCCTTLRPTLCPWPSLLRTTAP